MKAKRRIKIHINTDDVIREVEEDLIQTWQDGKLDFPASPLEAASLLSVQSLRFIRYAKGLSPDPPEAEFSTMLTYIQNRYTLSPDFPCTNQQLKDDIATKIQEILHHRKTQ